MIVKAVAGCSAQKIYEASSNSLPSHFVDGSTHATSLDGSSAPLRLVTQSFGKHVEVHLHHVDTIIVIRRNGRLLSAGVRLPELLLEQNTGAESYQLCRTGCLAGRSVDFRRALAPGARLLGCADDGSESARLSDEQRAAAGRLCRSANVTDFYFDSCVFDVLMSRTASSRNHFVAASTAALADMRRLFPAYTRHYETNRSSLLIYSRRPVDHGKAEAPSDDECHGHDDDRTIRNRSASTTFLSVQAFLVSLLLSFCSNSTS